MPARRASCIFARRGHFAIVCLDAAGKYPRRLIPAAHAVVEYPRLADKKLGELFERRNIKAFEVAVDLIVAKHDAEGIDLVGAQRLYGIIVDELQLLRSRSA